MKKLLFLILALIALLANSYAQQLPEFAPLGAKWHVSEYHFTTPPFVASFDFEVEALDNIKGQPCKRMNWLASGWFDSSYVYQDGLQIYTYDAVESHDWVLWLDFETEVDSSWTWIRSDYHYIDWLIQPNQDTGRVDTLVVTVIAKGDTTINGIELPWMDVISTRSHRYPNENCGYGSIEEFRLNDSTIILDTTFTRIVWGLGPLQGGLYKYCGAIDVIGQYEDLGHQFRCYEDSTLGLVTLFEHPLVTDCETEYFPNGGVSVDPEKQPRLTLAPNPARSRLRIEAGPELEGRPVDISLFDFAGKSVKRVKIVNWSGSQTLDLSGLNSGLYLVQMSSEGRLLASEKLVKE
ncbi:MAG: T9SS type A sorting domain-containing protein [Bacteroidia bacterium]